MCPNGPNYSWNDTGISISLYSVVPIDIYSVGYNSPKIQTAEAIVEQSIFQ